MVRICTSIHWDFDSCCPPSGDTEEFLRIVKNIYWGVGKTLNITDTECLRVSVNIYCYGNFWSDKLSFFWPLIKDLFTVRFTFVKTPESFARKMEYGMKYFTQGKPPPANLMVISGNPHVLSGLLEKFREQGYNILVAHPHGDDCPCPPHLDAVATYVWELPKLFSGEAAKPGQREMIWPTPPPSARSRGTWITWDLHTCPLPEDKKSEWCNMISNMRSTVDKSLNGPNTRVRIQAFSDYY